MDVQVTIEKLKISELKGTDKNPRQIRKKDFDALKRSLKDFPSMLEVREIVIDENNRVLGGHQRLKALQAQGVNEVTVKRVEGWTDEQKDEFLIKDNLPYGDWDKDRLANDWEPLKLKEWGLELNMGTEKDYKDLLSVDIPTYIPSPDPALPSELADFTEADRLNKQIDKAKLPEDIEKLCRTRASFFTDFNFQKIADYYMGADDKTKKLFRELGLVIVRPKEAFELGMVDFKGRLDG